MYVDWRWRGEKIRGKGEREVKAGRIGEEEGWNRKESKRYCKGEKQGAEGEKQGGVKAGE